MSSRLMTLYLWSALGIAMFSVAVSGTTLLFGLTSIGPFDPPPNSTMEHIGHVATFSAAVSGIFALMVGAIAIIAVIVAERAETRSIEQLKIDISRLWMALHSLRNRGLLYTSPEAARRDLDLFSQERQTIHEVLNSPTGFSIFAWQAAHEDRGFKDLTADLSGLINLTTLDVGENRAALFNSISIRANKIAERVSVLTDGDISEMASIVKRLGSGLDRAREIASKDNISNFLKEMTAPGRKNWPRQRKWKLRRQPMQRRRRSAEKRARPCDISVTRRAMEQRRRGDLAPIDREVGFASARPI